MNLAVNLTVAEDINRHINGLAEGSFRSDAFAGNVVCRTVVGEVRMMGSPAVKLTPSSIASA